MILSFDLGVYRGKPAAFVQVLHLNRFQGLVIFDSLEIGKHRFYLVFGLRIFEIRLETVLEVKDLSPLLIQWLATALMRRLVILKESKAVPARCPAVVLT